MGLVSKILGKSNKWRQCCAVCGEWYEGPRDGPCPNECRNTNG